MNPRKVVLGLLIAAAVVVLILRSEKLPDQSQAEVSDSEPANQMGPGKASSASDHSPDPVGGEANYQHTIDRKKPYDTGIVNDPRVQHTEEGQHVFIEAIGIARKIGQPEDEPEQDLEQFGAVLSFYRMAYEENPVAADNQSVMLALMGDNPRSLVFFPEDHPSLNGQGELMDRWGAPYYFHALSGKQMEIISTGPDRKLGSDDDLIHTQRNADEFFRGFTESPPDPTEEE